MEEAYLPNIKKRDGVLYAPGNHDLNEYIEERSSYLDKRNQTIKGTDYFSSYPWCGRKRYLDGYLYDTFTVLLKILCTCGVEITFVEIDNKSIETSTQKELEDFYKNRKGVDYFKNSEL